MFDSWWHHYRFGNFSEPIEIQSFQWVFFYTPIRKFQPKKKSKKDSSFTDKYKMKENKENLRTKKSVFFQTMSTKNHRFLTFLPTSCSSFKLTE